MGVFSFFSYAAEDKVDSTTGERHVTLQATSVIVPTHDGPSSSSKSPSSALNPQDTILASTTVMSCAQNVISVKPPVAETQVKARRFFFRTFGLVRKQPAEHKEAPSTTEEHGKREKVIEVSANLKSAQKVRDSKSDKRAKKSALLVRSLIIGPTPTAAPKMTRAVAKPQLSKIKSQLMKPKSANKIIAQLRELPSTGEAATNHHGHFHNGPIHAVCLEHADAVEESLHFAKLCSAVSEDVAAQSFNFTGVISAPVDKLVELFNEMHIVDLMKAPDLGLGQPGDGDGLLAGALPTPETVIEGVIRITPELMALGYATGRAIVPDHSGVYPPTDRMSVLTYWWGLEVLLPPPSLAYLGNAQSIAGAIMNFLSALSLINSGVREILPFIRYIAQFIDFEFSAIKRQDRGEGVVCAATWIMPAAMVPRPWDFPLPPQLPTELTDEKDHLTWPPGHGILLPSNPLPRPMSSILDIVASSPVQKSPAVQSPKQTRV